MNEKHCLILSDEFIRFCQLNKIENIEKTAKETFERGFTILKYGDVPNVKLPQIPQNKEKTEDIKIVKEKRDIYGD